MASHTLRRFPRTAAADNADANEVEMEASVAAEVEGEGEAPAAPSAEPPAEVEEEAEVPLGSGSNQTLLPADPELPGWTIVENKNGSTGRKWEGLSRARV